MAILCCVGKKCPTVRNAGGSVCVRGKGRWMAVEETRILEA